MESKDQAEGEGIGICCLERGPIGLPDERACTRGGRLLIQGEYIEKL